MNSVSKLPEPIKTWAIKNRKKVTDNLFLSFTFSKAKYPESMPKSYRTHFWYCVYKGEMRYVTVMLLRYLVENETDMEKLGTLVRDYFLAMERNVKLEKENRHEE